MLSTCGDWTNFDKLENAISKSCWKMSNWAKTNGLGLVNNKERNGKKLRQKWRQRNDTKTNQRLGLLRHETRKILLTHDITAFSHNNNNSIKCVPWLSSQMLYNKTTDIRLLSGVNKHIVSQPKKKCFIVFCHNGYQVVKGIE